MNSTATGDVAVSSLLAVWSPDGSPTPTDWLRNLADCRGGSLISRANVQVWYGRRGEPTAAPQSPKRLLLGDPNSLGALEAVAVSASAARLELDSPEHPLVSFTSITGLPPLYVAQSARLCAITSDLALLRAVPSLALEFDESALVEVARYGHPAGGRTLFRGISHLPAGARVEVTRNGSIRTAKAWSLPPRTPLSLEDYIEAQSAAFDAAVARLPVEHAFLSLTAGLDTRAVFAALLGRGHRLPAATMTGRQWSIDASIASTLSRGAGIDFIPVVFADEWERELPSLVERASVLSGGLEGFGQAPDLHMYDVLGPRFTVRCSGNLGNQVGRGGTEGISLRRVDRVALDAEFASAIREDEYWLLRELGDEDRDPLETLIQREVPFTLAANAGVGYSRALQVTPYADRALIETLSMRPSESAHPPSASRSAVRIRDLKHRLLGEPEQKSFQRRLVRRLGGIAAETPVNWGWKPTGGVSPVALGRGLLSGLGAAGRAGYLRPSSANRLVANSRIAALHSFRDNHRWLVGPLRTYLLDTLAVPGAQLPPHLDSEGVGQAVTRFLNGERTLQSTVIFALETTLAHRHFVSSGSGRRHND